MPDELTVTGRPGVHNDGDGTTEGWFRAPDGGFVTTEPVASEDWMPLNDYPTRLRRVQRRRGAAPGGLPPVAAGA